MLSAPPACLGHAPVRSAQHGENTQLDKSCDEEQLESSMLGGLGHLKAKWCLSPPGYTVLHCLLFFERIGSPTGNGIGRLRLPMAQRIKHQLDPVRNTQLVINPQQ